MRCLCFVEAHTDNIDQNNERPPLAGRSEVLTLEQPLLELDFKSNMNAKTSVYFKMFLFAQLKLAIDYSIHNYRKTSFTV